MNTTYMGTRDLHVLSDNDDEMLEPLDVGGLRAPFQSASATRLLTIDETPTSMSTSLPTPENPQTFLTNIQGLQPWVSSPHDPFSTLTLGEWDEFPQKPPPTPRLKDLDSFTDGTALGSFDFSLPSTQCGYDALSEPNPDPIPIPAPVSLAFSLENPSRSIELWRDNVMMSTSGEACEYTTGVHKEQGRVRGLKRHLSKVSVEAEPLFERRGRARENAFSALRRRDSSILPEEPELPMKALSAPSLT